jgi:hypothetical protein
MLASTGLPYLATERTPYRMSLPLRRFWIRFDTGAGSPLGYGVTAWTEQDALDLVRAAAFNSDEALPNFTIQADVDISLLDAGHIRPNMESPNWRGIWYPRGYATAH